MYPRNTHRVVVRDKNGVVVMCAEAPNRRTVNDCGKRWANEFNTANPNNAPHVSRVEKLSR